MEERRKTVRRKEDRERIALIEAGVDRRKTRDDKDGPARRKRRAIRHHCSAVIELRIAHAHGGSNVWTVGERQIKGRVIDLSEEGAQLFTRHPLEVGQDFKLKIDIEGKGKVIAPASVRWMKHIAQKNGYASGVAFAKLTVPDYLRIKEFLDHLDATLGL